MKYIGEYNVISIKKIVANFLRYFWIFLMCICISIGVILLGNNANSGDSMTTEEYTITLGIASKENQESLEDKYYENELKKQTLYETVKMVFQTTEVINDKLKENGYTEIMPTEIPTYVGYTISDKFITLNVNSINKERAKFILKVYEEECINTCQQIDSNFEIKKIAQSENVKGIEKTNGKVKSILLILVGGLLGIVVIGFIILFDERIYSEKELRACFEFDKFCEISKENICLNENWIKCYVKQHRIKRILFIELMQNQIPMKAFKNLLEKYSEISISNQDEYYDAAIEADAICIAITLGKTKISEVNSILEGVNSLGCTINGCIICKMVNKG